MAIKNFIPSVWSGSILRAVESLLVYGSPNVINTDYEGEISQHGDSVKIQMVGDVEIKDYVRNQDIDPPEELTDAQLTLLIDQQKYFNFAVDDVDKRQAMGDPMDEAAESAGRGLRSAMDAYIASLYTEIAPANFVGDDTTPIVDFDSDAKKAYAQLTKLRTKLDDAEAPEDGRFVVVPPWFEEYLINDDRFVSFGTGDNHEVLANGRVGAAAGFTIYKSTRVPNTAGAKYKIIAGHKSGWSRAQQILDTKAYEPERRFADALKGLHVYGAKVVRPKRLACLVATDS